MENASYTHTHTEYTQKTFWIENRLVCTKTESEDVNELCERIESLKRELLEEKQTRNAAEEA